jgi:hypothetical protein
MTTNKEWIKIRQDQAAFALCDCVLCNWCGWLKSVPVRPILSILSVSVRSPPRKALLVPACYRTGTAHTCITSRKAGSFSHDSTCVLVHHENLTPPTHQPSKSVNTRNFLAVWRLEVRSDQVPICRSTQHLTPEATAGLQSNRRDHSQSSLHPKVVCLS